jgi:DNA-binding protein HU-beta
MAKATTRKTSTSKAKAPRSNQAAKAKKSAKPAVKRYRATPVDKSDREQLMAVIQEATGCSAKAAKEAFDGLIGTITASLKKNKKVQLTGFGSFTVAKRPARKGRNPRTGEAIRIKASKTIRFRTGQTLKRSL